MASWIARKIRAGRLSMNLNALEAGVLAAPPQRRAEMVVAAASLVQKLRKDDFILGAQLERAVLEPRGTAAEDAESFYNSLEDILTATELHRKQVVKQIASQSGRDASMAVDQNAKLKQQGIRLLMVALARKVDTDFKPKAHRVREPLYEAEPHIATAVSALVALNQFASTDGMRFENEDFEVIKTIADLLCFSFIGW